MKHESSIFDELYDIINTNQYVVHVNIYNTYSNTIVTLKGQVTAMVIVM